MNWGKVASSTASGAGTGAIFGGIGAPIGAGIGFLSGMIGSMFSSDSEQSDAIKKLMERLRQVQGYSREQINTSVNDISKSASTVMAASVNNYAIGSAGKQNMMNAQVAKLIPQVASLGAERRMKMEDYNKNLETQKINGEAGMVSGLNADTPQDDFFSMLGLAAEGFQLGGQIGNRKNPTDPSTLLPEGSDMNSRFVDGSSGVSLANPMGKVPYSEPSMFEDPMFALMKMKKYSMVR